MLLYAGAEPWTGPLRIVGTSTVGDREISRVASASTSIWSIDNVAERYQKARLSSTQRLSVVQQPHMPMAFAPKDGKTTWDSCLGAKLDLPFIVNRRGELKGDITIGCESLPGYNKLPTEKVAKDKNEGLLKFDFNKNTHKGLKPGTYHLVFTAASAFKWAPDPAPKTARRKR